MSKQAMIKTELGLLPSDWKIVSLQELFKTFPSASFSREEMEAEEGVACVHYGDIHKRFGKIVNLDEEKLPLVTSEQAHRYKLLKDGDVLLADASEDDEGIGKSIIVLVGKHPAIAGLHTIPLRVKTNDIDTCFPTYLFAGKLVKRQIEKLSEGTKVNSITFNKICNVFLPIPPAKDEQKRIATALYDIDTLIRNLDRTIEKKKNIRQGAMEQLLSGKKRLPGFKGEWEQVEIGNVCKRMKRGEVLSAAEMNTGVFPVIAAGTEPAGHCDKYNRNPMTISVSGSGANAGFVAFHKNRIFATDCFTIGASEEYDVEFIYYVLKMRQKEIFKLQTGGAQPHVYPRDLSSMSVYYTADLQEQRAIADTLTAMDDEIAVLQMERDKYANIRSGMMDDLLTGAKRL